MTLPTVTRYLLRNDRTGEKYPMQFASAREACAVADDLNWQTRPWMNGAWRVFSQLIVIQPEVDRV